MGSVVKSNGLLHSPTNTEMRIDMWQLQYYNRPEFLASFESEQDYVDAMFILIIYQNFGILLRQDMLMH